MTQTAVPENKLRQGVLKNGNKRQLLEISGNIVLKKMIMWDGTPFFRYKAVTD